MARLARVVVPGYPHHITQRGNRRQNVFFQEGDYSYYLGLLKEWCGKEKVEIWVYCLMTNHVHLIVKPNEDSSLSKAIGETHRRYTRMINFRENWRGYLWQGRFASFVMDESWLLRAVAYVELNPVKAGMVEKAWALPKKMPEQFEHRRIRCCSTTHDNNVFCWQRQHAAGSMFAFGLISGKIVYSVVGSTSTIFFQFISVEPQTTTLYTLVNIDAVKFCTNNLLFHKQVIAIRAFHQ